MFNWQQLERREIMMIRKREIITNAANWESSSVIFFPLC